MGRESLMGGHRQNIPAGARDAATLRQALQAELNRLPTPAGNVPGNVPKTAPALIALCGLPGTGKSHFAAALARRVPALILGSDRLRKLLIPQPRYTREEHSRVFAAAHCLLEQLLTAGYRVIFDATNLTERARQPLYDIAGRTGARLLLVKLDAPEALIRQRLARRAAGVRAGPPSYTDWSDADWQIYCRLRPGAEPPERPHFRVDSAQDITPALEEIARLLEAGLPGIELPGNS